MKTTDHVDIGHVESVPGDTHAMRRMQDRVALAALNEVSIQQVAVLIEFRDKPVVVGCAGFAIGIGDEIALPRRMSDKGLGAAQLGNRIGKSR